MDASRFRTFPICLRYSGPLVAVYDARYRLDSCAEEKLPEASESSRDCGGSLDGPGGPNPWGRDRAQRGITMPYRAQARGGDPAERLMGSPRATA
jgi:hypothetical protein